MRIMIGISSFVCTHLLDRNIYFSQQRQSVRPDSKSQLGFQVSMAQIRPTGCDLLPIYFRVVDHKRIWSYCGLMTRDRNEIVNLVALLAGKQQ